MAKRSARNQIENNQPRYSHDREIDMGLRALAGVFYWTLDDKGMPCVKRRDEKGAVIKHN